ncbi:hypothetical protein CK203_095214 [Vitis vinifera]|uniref:Uncharacterized protein n=1 Tax=Vitis vinifera TaxID=29760 RepID=A0A438BPU4_VITVI|nr:hypothetical protein CK203_095214 [Vitis vinifera]
MFFPPFVFLGSQGHIGCASEENRRMDDRFSSEGLISADFDNLGIETNEGENQVEVNHLKLMLER